MKEIPKIIRNFIIRRDRGKCRTCGGAGEHIHHIYSRKAEFPNNLRNISKTLVIQNNNNQPENLLLLCPKCHNKLHNGKMIINKEAYIKHNVEREEFYYKDHELLEYLYKHASKLVK